MVREPFVWGQATTQHPLTGDYELLAIRIYADGNFRKWLE
jgi:hypothetical protein